MHPNPKKILPVVAGVLVLAALAAGWWYLTRVVRAAGDGLTASGTIEAQELNVSPELGGRVVTVTVQEGEAVAAGAVLVQFDPALLESQRAQAAAALAVAQANYTSLKSGATADQLTAALARAELERLSAAQALQAVEDNAAAASAQAQARLAKARQTLDKAERTLRNLNSPDLDYYQDRVKRAQDALANAQDNATITDIGALNLARQDAQKQLEDATELYNDAQAAFAACPQCTTVLVKGRKWEWPDVVDAYNTAVNRVKELDLKIAQADRSNSGSIDQLQDVLDDAQTDLDNALAGPGALDLAVAQAGVAQAEAEVVLAAQAYTDTLNGPDAEVLALAQARLTSAETTVTAAQAALGPASLEAAQAQVAQAEAALAALDTQLVKLTLTAPTAGVVLARTIEPGEVASAGATVLVLAQLEQLNITVYVPEDRYGQIRLGQAASVTVDSFPGETFAATVTHIADQAEFTPRNVQTVSGRKVTVFAIKLTIANPENKLKPGMPADVAFEK